MQPDRVAQTNLQLYLQLIDDHWEEEALKRVAASYELALRLFGTQVRPNRKPFVSHLVGTASVAAMQCADADIVTASLLHAAYESGAWGDGRSGYADSRRELLRRSIGIAAESLVARYTALEWNYRTTEALLERLGSFDEEEEAVLLMRLSNEVDEWVDGGLRFSVKGDFARFQPENVKSLVNLAQGLGYRRIAELLERLATEGSAPVIPASLRIVTTATSGTVVTPQAPLVRFAVRLNSKIEHLSARTRRTARAREMKHSGADG